MRGPRRISRYVVPVIALGVLAGAAYSRLYGCGGRHGVEVSVSVAADSPTPVDELVAIAGADKFSWYSLTPGQTVKVVLDPAEAPPEITLIYARGGTKHSWEGPKFPLGTRYRLHAVISSAGVMSERHCVLPCLAP